MQWFFSGGWVQLLCATAVCWLPRLGCTNIDTTAHRRSFLEQVVLDLQFIACASFGLQWLFQFGNALVTLAYPLPQFHLSSVRQRNEHHCTMYNSKQHRLRIQSWFCYQHCHYHYHKWSAHGKISFAYLDFKKNAVLSLHPVPQLVLFWLYFSQVIFIAFTSFFQVGIISTCHSATILSKKDMRAAQRHNGQMN